MDGMKEELKMAGTPLDFKTEFNHVAREVHANAVNKGFWDRKPAAPELIALAHSELSEMLEAYRHGNGSSSKIAGFSAAEEELADLVIRAMDMAQGLELRLAEAIVAKIQYNAPRERMHGKSF
jgi:NTP pyrophosphatase (non-canonical NTP hydrolase)